DPATASSGRPPRHRRLQASGRPWRKDPSAYQSVDDAAYIAGQSLHSSLGASRRIGRQLPNGGISVRVVLRMPRRQTREILAGGSCTIAIFRVWPAAVSSPPLSPPKPPPPPPSH